MSSLRVDEEVERKMPFAGWWFAWELSQGGIGVFLSLISMSSSSSESSDTIFGKGDATLVSFFSYLLLSACSGFVILGSDLHLGGILLVFFRVGGVKREFSKLIIVAASNTGVVIGDAKGVDAPLRSEWLYMSESVEGYPCRRCGEWGREVDAELFAAPSAGANEM